MNMRYGNEEKRREIAEQVKSPHIRSVKDVEADRKSRCYQMSKKVRRRVLLQTLKNEGIPDLKTDRLIPHYLRNRLLQEGIYCVSKGVEINDLISFCRPRGKVRKMLELLNGLT
jgi:ribosomal protein S26